MSSSVEKSKYPSRKISSLWANASACVTLTPVIPEKYKQKDYKRITTAFLHDEAIEGRMRGKPTTERNQMLHDSANHEGYVALKLAAEDREEWRQRESLSKTCSSADYWWWRHQSVFHCACVCEQKTPKVVDRFGSNSPGRQNTRLTNRLISSSAIHCMTVSFDVIRKIIPFHAELPNLAG